jgi:hypothetical protein
VHGLARSGARSHSTLLARPTAHASAIVCLPEHGSWRVCSSFHNSKFNFMFVRSSIRIQFNTFLSSLSLRPLVFLDSTQKYRATLLHRSPAFPETMRTYWGQRFYSWGSIPSPLRPDIKDVQTTQFWIHAPCFFNTLPFESEGVTVRATVRTRNLVV